MFTELFAKPYISYIQYLLAIICFYILRSDEILDEKDIRNVGVWYGTLIALYSDVKEKEKNKLRNSVLCSKISAQYKSTCKNVIKYKISHVIDKLIHIPDTNWRNDPEELDYLMLWSDVISAKCKR